MTGLVLFVARAGVVDVAKAVESELTIAFEAVGSGATVDFLVGFVAFVGGHGVDEAAAAGDLLESGVDEAAEHAVLEGLVEIADLPQFFFDVTLLDFFGEGAERFCGGVAGFQDVENCFGGQHAALHGHVDAFEALRIEEAAGIADDERAVYVSAGYGVPAAVGERLGAVADEFAALENFIEERVRLPGLEGGVGIELGVGVFESDDETDGEAVVGEAVNPAAAVHAGGNGPA